MHVGIFGGSFNPPHLAHLIVAETVRDQFDLDRVLWIPSYQPPHKQGTDLAPAAHRLRMTRLATRDHEAFAVSDCEVRRAGPSYTVDTVKELQETHPEATLSLIVGSDSMRAFDSWHQPDEIIRRVPLIVYYRPGATSSVVKARFKERVRFADAPLLEISGSDIRSRLRRGRSIRYLVSDPVWHYLAEHGLYVQDALQGTGDTG